MCGISGIAAPSGDLLPIVERQLDLLHHRGPDARGHFSSEGAVIAQNRLSIIDLQAGNPPLMNEDETIGVVLNGELYDYADHRAQLAARGTALPAEATPRSLRISRRNWIPPGWRPPSMACSHCRVGLEPATARSRS